MPTQLIKKGIVVNKVRVLAKMLKRINHFLLGIEETEVIEKKPQHAKAESDDDHAVIKSIN